MLFAVLFFPGVHAAIYYKAADNRVVISGSETLSRVLNYQSDSRLFDSLIRKTGNECYLRVPIHISENSTFSFLGSDCKVLHMYPDTYIRIAGSAFFKDIKVISADPITNEPIKITRIYYDKPRPHIYTDRPAKYVGMENSEFAYLGYYNKGEGSKWGVSFWHLQAGYITNSKFHDNYFGIYTWGTTNVTIENSEVYDNLEYGMDFHDYSDNFIVANNVVYNNGNHGIIFSKWCDNNRVINNLVYDNTQNAFVKGYEQDYGTHGIMLHKQSNHNIVQGNTLRNNRIAIFLYQSDNNTVRDNIIINDLEEGIYVDQSYGNTFTNNVVYNTSSYGLYSYYSDHNDYSGNYFDNTLLFKGLLSGKPYRYETNSHNVPANIDELLRLQVQEDIAPSAEPVPEDQPAEDQTFDMPPAEDSQQDTSTAQLPDSSLSGVTGAVVDGGNNDSGATWQMGGVGSRLREILLSGNNLALKVAAIVAIVVVATGVIFIEIFRRPADDY